MNEIRILINSDEASLNFREFFSDQFLIDERSLANIGVNNSADTLTEYDAIMISHSKEKTIPEERITQLLKFLNDEKKLFVYILNKYVEQHHYSSMALLKRLVESLGGNFDHFIYKRPTGSRYNLVDAAKKNLFYNYLNKEKRDWVTSFHDRDYNFIIPLALNHDNDIVAFSVDNDIVKATNIFLPWLKESEVSFWEIIIRFLQDRNKDFLKVDQWVNQYSFSQLDKLNNYILEKQNIILAHEKEKSQLEEEKKKYERIRNTLLYHDGDLLKDVSKEVLNEIGLKTEDGKQGREDLVFVCEGEHYLIEVKGTEKSASKTHVRQLTGHLTEYRDENEVPIKGILLINAWRKLPIEERGTGDKPIFPEDIMKLVNLSEIALITTQQLFVMYCEHLEEKFDLKSFFEKLKKTKGVFEGFDDIGLYKKKEVIINAEENKNS